MINARKIGGGYWKSSIHPHSEEGGKALTVLVSFTDYPKGGLRWNNISVIGGGIDG